VAKIRCRVLCCVSAIGLASSCIQGGKAGDLAGIIEQSDAFYNGRS
jgi:hypothetical protein